MARIKTRFIVGRGVARGNTGNTVNKYAGLCKASRGRAYVTVLSYSPLGRTLHIRLAIEQVPMQRLIAEGRAGQTIEKRINNNIAAISRT